VWSRESRVSFTRLRQPDALELLERRGVPAVWRESTAGHLSRVEEARRQDRADRPRASAIGRLGCAGPAAADDPGRRVVDRPHVRRRARRRLSLLSASRLVGLAPRVMHSESARPPADFPRPGPDAALGRGRGSQTRSSACRTSAHRSPSRSRRPRRAAGRNGELGDRLEHGGGARHVVLLRRRRLFGVSHSQPVSEVMPSPTKATSGPAASGGS
jgi:hypothetical protein